MSGLLHRIIISLLLAQAPDDSTGTDRFYSLVNQGKAHLENRDSAKAIEAFEAALRLNPRSAPVLRDLARAQMLMRKYDAALARLDEARTLETESVAASYLTGLAYLRTLKPREAVQHLEAAARRDAASPVIRYQLALACQATGSNDRALQQLQETIRLDPRHAAAHYKLAAFAREKGETDSVQLHLREFTRLRRLFGEETRSTEALEQCVYTRPEGIERLALPAQNTARVVVRFVDTTPRVLPHEADHEAERVAVLDVAADGVYTFVITDPQRRVKLARWSTAGEMRITTTDSKIPFDSSTSCCIVGDFQNEVPKGEAYDPGKHALNDIAFVGPEGVCLLRRKSADRFEDVTTRCGIRSKGGQCAGWVDYDHDGDLDLVIGTASGMELWQNKGDGAFEEAHVQAGLTAAGPIIAIGAADLDANVAIDLVAARGKEGTLVFENRRLGQFALRPDPPGPWPAAREVLLDDLDGDLAPDTVLVGEKEIAFVFSRSAARHSLPLSGLAPAAAALLDFDNDGRLDLCVVGHSIKKPDVGEVRVWRNEGGTTWQDVSAQVGVADLRFPPIREVTPADYDNDADSDLVLLTRDDKMRILRNDGGSANGQLKVHLQGTKSNPNGLGTHVEARAGSFQTSRCVRSLPIELGLGGLKKLDALQVVWTNGVVENRIDFAVPAEPVTIVERNVATGSCPFLYAWDGKRFRFVTDLLGNSPVGLPLRRDQLLAADPDEFVEIGPATTLAPQHGDYVLEVTSEFREAVYLDYAKLVAIDHSPNVEVHPTDKLMPPPFPRSELWALGTMKPLQRAISSDGVERTEALRVLDGVFAPPGHPLPPPYRGMCQPLQMEFDFGSLDVERPLVLALSGWLQYGDASANIAISQNRSLTIVSPTLEARVEDRKWSPIDVVVGMPAGKTKTILCDLAGRLPRGTRRLRLTTTFEIRWDRIALFERQALPPDAKADVCLKAADLRWRGFSPLERRAPQHPTTPDHDVILPAPPWRTMVQGWCTRYGEVLELVAAADDRLVIINGGDALRLRFAAESLPLPSPGNTRTFFFYSRGWDKDSDHNVVEGDAVEPLPNEGAMNAESEPDDWRVRYNTRWVPRNVSGTP